MADSKLSQHKKRGLLIEATAYRVKFRKDCGLENGCKMKVLPIHLGTHKGNRGGVYPAGVRCKELLF